MKYINIDIIKKISLEGDNLGFALEIEPLGKQVTFPKTSIDLDKSELLELREKFDRALGINEIVEKFKLNTDNAIQILQYHLDKNNPCNSCELYMKDCYECVFTYTDKLENHLFREYKQRGLSKKEILNRIKQDTQQILNEHSNFEDCNYNYRYRKEYTCDAKYEKCFECVFICESHLERKLFMGISSRFNNVELQKRINKDGHLYNYPHKVDFSKILTIPDFYIELNSKKVCIYADGFTYHERTETQAIRDRNIDRELQQLGFTVLRFTTKEITGQIEKVLDVINNAIY